MCAIAFVWIYVYSIFFDTPKEKRLHTETNRLLDEYKIVSENMQQAENILNRIVERDNKVYRAVFEEDSIPYTIRNAGFGGVDRYAKYRALDAIHADMIADMYRKMDILDKKAYIQSKSFDLVAELAKGTDMIQRCMPVLAPVDLSQVRLASLVGWRHDPVLRGQPINFHAGIDLAGPVGLPVYATGDGVVIRAEYTPNGYGNVVDIEHGFGYLTRYAHLSAITAHQGQRIKRGAKVGELGSTGKSKGPHLHYEVRLKETVLNPLNFFEHHFNERPEEVVFADSID
jgi:murein DD-endopeptidase MepM/ murein hydrolase activator NlpD